jgi:hypothetical protein
MKTPEDVINRFINEENVKFNQERDNWMMGAMEEYGLFGKEYERQQYFFYDVRNRALWRIEPYFDGISTAVTTYKVVDQNGTLQYMGDRKQCEYFLQHGC